MHRQEAFPESMRNTTFLAPYLVQRVGVAFNMFFSDAAEHFPVTPAGVDQNDRYKHQRNPGHQVQRSLAGGRIPHGQARIHHGAGRHHKREHCDTGSQDDAGQGQRREQECPCSFLHTGGQDSQQRQNHAQRRNQPQDRRTVEVHHPRTGFTRDFFGQRVRCGVMIHRGSHDITINTVNHPYARQREAHQRNQRGYLCRRAGTQVQLTHGTHLQIGRALGNDHPYADDTCQQAKRVQQLEEVTGVVQTQILVDMERYALQQVAKRHADNQRRHKAPHEDAPVPHVAPAGVFNLGTVVKTDRTEEQGRQHEDHRHIETGKRRSVNHRPGGEQRATGGDQPHLVTVPVRGDGVDHNSTLGVVTTEETGEHAHPHVEAIGNRKTDQQNANQQPPDKTQYFIIDHLTTPVLACRLRGHIGLLKVIATGFQAAWATACKLEH
ncbi:hypothetical protein CKO_02407 [Citrobacter koseri ATCC BAA-895]|uniref:Uncharacterized protein n=1 Tax=Citrobacter koseri (strain ATCC BAA-895 / CDC 4225-83 / SGSC4696) TaxID=290338 RepID=A8AJ62_CITK8|nr:hypothetical protein CKO_02407 [Citrobacter koseri ATCC BAA-895]